MRRSGRPDASTVASDMALGSLGSDLHASANHSANSAKGSWASVKSPDVNWVGCLMSVVSVILPEFSSCVPRFRARCGQCGVQAYIGHGRALAYRRSALPE